jgi:hypothetical protein
MLRFIAKVIVIIATIVSKCASEPAPPGSIQMRIVNHAGAPIELFWINTFEPHRPLVKQTTKAIRNNTDTVVSNTEIVTMFDKQR